MIKVFGLVEQNPDGGSRIRSLIEHGYTRVLTDGQVKEAIILVEDYPIFLNEHLTTDSAFEYAVDLGLQEHRNLNLTEKVTALDKAGFLFPAMTAGNMICVFDLIEHNDGGQQRLNRLVEEQCVIGLDQQQMDAAINILND